MLTRTHTHMHAYSHVHTDTHALTHTHKRTTYLEVQPHGGTHKGAAHSEQSHTQAGSPRTQRSHMHMR